MPALVLSEQGTRLTKRGERLIVLKGPAVILDVPIASVERVQVMGQGVQVSTAVSTFLSQHHIPLVYTNRQGTKVHAVLSSAAPRQAQLRLAQARWIIEPHAGILELVRSMIHAKLINQRMVLDVYGRDWAGQGPTARRVLDEMIQRTLQSQDLDQIRGYEGAGAAAYWSAWRAVFQASWKFAGRQYHPPPDPLNALLSFGYTLLLNDLMTALHLTGLDPALGFFHVPQNNRPSLALDLEEEFRPWVIDGLVLELLDSGQIQQQQFAPSPARSGAIHLNEQLRDVFITAYATRLQQRMAHPWTTNEERIRTWFVLQSQQLARLIDGEQPRYLPLLWQA